MNCFNATLLGSLVACLAVPLSAATFVEVDRVELIDIDPATDNGRLGSQLVLDGTTAMASAPFKNGQNGAVYVFDLERDGTLTFRQPLEPTGNFSQFGTSLALDGDWAAVADSLFSTQVRLFRRSGGSWVESQLIELEAVPATDSITLRALGTSLAMSGDLLVAGDTGANVVVGGDTVDNAGAIVLFRRGGDDVWRHEASLASTDPVGASAFGRVVAAAGDTVVVGAPNDDVDGISRGRAHVFQRSAGQWSGTRILADPDETSEASFAWSVALEGDVAIIGCATCNVTQDGPSNAG